MAKGKSKGSRFERDVCKFLSRWVSKGKEHDCFWRSAMSGGRATQGNKQNGGGFDNCAGDITCTGATGRKLVENFVVECKFIRDLHLEHFLFGYEPLEVSRWLEKLLGECGGKREPLLVMRQNFQDTVCLPVWRGGGFYPLAGLC